MLFELENTLSIRQISRLSHLPIELDLCFQKSRLKHVLDMYLNEILKGQNISERLIL